MNSPKNFQYNAPQYLNFLKDFNIDNQTMDSYFEVDHEVVVTGTPVIKTSVEEQDTTMQEFFSPEPYTPEVTHGQWYLRTNLRKSISMGNLPTDDAPAADIDVNIVTEQVKEMQLNKHSSDKIVKLQLNQNKLASKRMRLNKLAQAKQKFSSCENVVNHKYISMAEAAIKFQQGTPERFHSRPSTYVPIKSTALVTTKAISPNLATKTRVRPISAISNEEKEKQEMEAAKKFCIKAKPLNYKLLQRPSKLKVPVEKKPVTKPEPFKLTEIQKKIPVTTSTNGFVFHAKPAPKFIRDSSKLVSKQIKPSASVTKAQFEVTKASVNQELHNTQFHLPLQNTQCIPFSFDERNKRLLEKKEEYINKAIEEERKLREFHARPLPKSIFKSPLHRSQRLDQRSENGEIQETNLFKARPATVLNVKPFEPRKIERPLVEISEFTLNTDRRAKDRKLYEQHLKERENRIEEMKQKKYEDAKKQEEAEIAKLRKAMEIKAQAVRHYSEVKTITSKQMTIPKTPNFDCKKRNKENSLD